MNRVLRHSTEVKILLAELEKSPAQAGLLKQIRKALGYLEKDPGHPSLKTHEFTSLSTKDCEVFESYAQNNTPGAYRMFWHYGPDEYDKKKKRIPVISVFAITPHP